MSNRLKLKVKRLKESGKNEKTKSRCVDVELQEDNTVHKMMLGWFLMNKLDSKESAYNYAVR